MSALKPILYALTAALAAVLVTTTSALAGSGVAQRRLHQRWQHLYRERRKPAGVVAIACARELAAFLWEAATLD